MASEPAPQASTDPRPSRLDDTDPDTGLAAGSVSPLSTLSYRSRAVAPMSELVLHRLAKAAQVRNLFEGVTGLMVYDRGWIYQTLEGPGEGLERIWASIRKDVRHAAIEVLATGAAEQRQFPDWGLKLSVHGAQAGLGAFGMSDDPPELIDRLCRGERPDDLFETAWPRASEDRNALTLASDALVVSQAALAELIAKVVVPQLQAAQPSPATPSPSATLALLLTALDASSAFAFVENIFDRHVSLGSLSADLLEPAARELGDLWQSDECSEVEVTLGLIRLQAIAREIGLGIPRLKASHPPVVLVVPSPGEAHMLGAALDAEMLWQAGWTPRIDFPSSSGALDTLVASTWIDALDLSLSTSFRRDHRLEQVGQTIANARLASLNPGLVVVVSGRVFSLPGEAGEREATGRHLGADGIFGSASQAQAAILEALRHPLSGKVLRSVG